MFKIYKTGYMLEIKVIPNVSTNVVEVIDNVVKVRVSEKPTDGKANTKVIELLSKYFNVPKTKITIVKGHKNRHKVVLFDVALAPMVHI